MNIEQGPLTCHTLSAVQRGGSLQQTSVVLRFDMWTPCGHKKKDLSLHQLLEEPWGEKNQGTSEPWKSVSQESFLMFVLYMAILGMWSTQISTSKIPKDVNLGFVILVDFF